MAHKQPLGQTELMNVVDEKAQETASRERSSPAFKDPDDMVCQPLPFSSERDAGAQPSFPLEPGAHFEPSPPENLKAILLEAAKVLELVGAHIEQCTASLHYFVKLGSGNGPRDFADVKCNLTNIHTLMNSSAPILLAVQKLAVGFRAIATPVAGFTPDRLGEPKRANMIQVPLEESSTDKQSMVQVDPISTQEQPDEQKTVNPRFLEPSSFSDASGRSCPEPRTQDEQKPVDFSSTPNEQGEPKRENMILSKLEVPLEERRIDTQPLLEVDPVPTQEHRDEQKPGDAGSSNEQDQPMWVDMVLSETKVRLPACQGDPALAQEQQNEAMPVDPGSTSNERDQPKRVDMIPPKERSTDSQPTLQIDPAPPKKQQDEQKRIDMVLSEIQIILTERPSFEKAGIKRGNSALPASENDGFDASLTTKEKCAIPLNAHRTERKQTAPKISDPFTQEIEALLGISTFPDAEDFFPSTSSNSQTETGRG
jgi:hypothetical protein